LDSSRQTASFIRSTHLCTTATAKDTVTRVEVIMGFFLAAKNTPPTTTTFNHFPTNKPVFQWLISLLSPSGRGVNFRMHKQGLVLVPQMALPTPKISKNNCNMSAELSSLRVLMGTIQEKEQNDTLSTTTPKVYRIALQVPTSIRMMIPPKNCVLQHHSKTTKSFKWNEVPGARHQPVGGAHGFPTPGNYSMACKTFISATIRCFLHPRQHQRLGTTSPRRARLGDPLLSQRETTFFPSQTGRIPLVVGPLYLSMLLDVLE
jgi:hypothetical protein